MTETDAMLPHLVGRVRGEFLEMPGLRLVPEQAARLLALEPAVSARILEALVQDGFLCRTTGGAYLRVDLER